MYKIDGTVNEFILSVYNHLFDNIDVDFFDVENMDYDGKDKVIRFEFKL